MALQLTYATGKQFIIKISESHFYSSLLLTIVWMLGIFPYVIHDRIPIPRVHDEFSYLLAAETFVEGRLSNPPLKPKSAFATFHVLVEPVHMSKYPPGIGLQLAFGILLGHPIFGVWLTVLACGFAARWMSREILPSSWGLLFAIILMFQSGLYGRFGFSYWGGSLFLLGGILATGAFFRLRIKFSYLSSVIFGFAGGVLLITRPIEGTALGLILSTFLLYTIYQRRSKWVYRQYAMCGLIGLIALLPAAGFFALCNQAATGSFFRPAYLEYRAQVPTIGVFNWTEKSTLSDELPKPFHDLANQNLRRKAPGITAKIRALAQSCPKWIFDFAPGIWAIPLIIFILFFPKRKDPVYLLVLSAFAFRALHFLLFSSSAYSHYFSAFYGITILGAICGTRLMISRLMPPPGNRAFSIILLISLWISSATALHWEKFLKAKPNCFQYIRKYIVSTLENDLIFVRYNSHHTPHLEWVYNSPIPDDADIIWAHYNSLGSAMQLAKQYSNRNIWILNVDSDVIPPVLIKFEDWIREQEDGTDEKAKLTEESRSIEF